MGLVQCAIEREGIPTVSVTVRPEISCALGVPRSGHVRFPTGQVFGEPHQGWQHERVLSAALDLVATMRSPGVVDLPFRWRRWRTRRA